MTRRAAGTAATVGARATLALATVADVAAVDRVWYPFRNGKQPQLDFVPLPKLREAAAKGELIVAWCDGQIVGFVYFHTRRDGLTKLFDIAVSPDYQGRGIGRMLLYSVPCPFQLKTTQDNAAANRFYRQAGMSLIGTEQSTKRLLNVYEMRVLNIINRGNNPNVPRIARESGSAYGTKEVHKAYAWPFMVDCEFEKPRPWYKYMQVIRDLRPVMALTVDYTDPSKKLRMLAQVRRLRKAGVLRVVVCVKFHGAAYDVPADCIIGVSLRTEGNLAKGKHNPYSGFMPHFNELAGRKVHLLGGSPQLQIDTLCKLRGVGAHVLSVDGNGQFGASAYGTVYESGKQRGAKKRERTNSLIAQVISSRNIQREINAAGLFKQLPLFEALP